MGTYHKLNSEGGEWDIPQTVNSERGENGDIPQTVNSERGENGDIPQTVNSERGENEDIPQIVNSGERESRGRLRTYHRLSSQESETAGGEWGYTTNCMVEKLLIEI